MPKPKEESCKFNGKWVGEDETKGTNCVKDGTLIYLMITRND
jgi:hypothetical protein